MSVKVINDTPLDGGSEPFVFDTAAGYSMAHFAPPFRERLNDENKACDPLPHGIWGHPMGCQSAARTLSTLVCAALGQILTTALATICTTPLWTLPLKFSGDRRYPGLGQ
jgi:hypothetical protein